jgi:hypothetical protein
MPTAYAVSHFARRASLPLFAAGSIVVAAVLWFLVFGPPPPPGWIRDEASISFNALTLSRNLHDQNGGLLPLYIKSWGDYKSPLFVYLLAAVFRVTGPSEGVAIAFAGVVVAAAILLLGGLAWKRTHSLFAACATIAIGASTPWLYDLSKVVYETAIEPLTVVCVLFALNWAYRSRRSDFARAAPLALALGALTYSYAAGRLLAPLWAAALIIFATRGRRRWVLTTWGLYVLTLVPIFAYLLIHSGALASRFRETTWLRPGMSIGTIVVDFFSNYGRDANPWYWVTSGDIHPYIHVWGTPQLYAVTGILALAGVFLILRHERRDRFWWFVGLALVIAPTADAVTRPGQDSLRLLPLPLLLMTLGIPALRTLGRAAAAGWPARLAVAGLALVLVVQIAQYRSNYLQKNGGRAVLFENDVPVLLQRAFAGGNTVYIDHDDIYAQTHALWYAVTHGIAQRRVSILPEGGIPPKGSMVFGRLQPCDYVCPHIADAETYWIARAAGPAP